MGYDFVMRSIRVPTFRSDPFFHLLHGRTLFVCFEVGGSKLLRNIVPYVPVHKTIYPRQEASSAPL